MAKRRSRYYKHIYFESKRPRTRDSVTLAVRDIGKAGVNTSKEVCALAVAQFLDWLDGYTYNHAGKRVRFTGRLWAGRTLVLKRSAKKYGGMRCVNYVVKLKKMVDSGKLSKSKARQMIIKYAKQKSLPITKTKI